MTRCIQCSFVCVIAISASLFADETKPTVKPQSKKTAVKPNTAKPNVAKSKPRAALTAEVLEFNAASKAQLDATIEYAKANSVMQKLTVKLAVLKKQAGNAASAEQQKAIDEVQNQLVVATKDAQEKQRKSIAAATNARVVAAKATMTRTTPRYRPVTITVRKEVNEEDNKERFLLLLPGGPLVIETTLMDNGKSFRARREALITKMLDSSDKNKDSKTSWAEALDSPRFTMGRLRFTTAQQSAGFQRSFDANRNGFVDRVEARQYLSQYFGGPAFNLTGSNYRRVTGINGRVTNGSLPDIKVLLDTDKDGSLSKQEIAATSERLKSRDADDNDMLYITELAVRSQRSQGRSFGTYRPAPLFYMIGPTVSDDQIHNVLMQIYKNFEGKILAAQFSEVPNLFAELDTNKNGELESFEVGRLNSVTPRIAVQVDFSKPQGESMVVTDSKTNSDASLIRMPGYVVSLFTNTKENQAYDYSRAAKNYFDRYDNNKNGYLEKDEVPATLQSQFELWDIDKDAKVFVKEIEESFTLGQLPSRTQVRATITNQGNSLFKTLDLSGDSRLSLREMKTAQKQILAFDTNNDGTIESSEIPQTISVTFSRGNPISYYRAGQTIARNRPANSNPAWFNRMDRNGDGDITLKEFLGKKADFAKLDKNDDGFIEPAEAKQAK